MYLYRTQKSLSHTLCYLLGIKRKLFHKKVDCWKHSTVQHEIADSIREDNLEKSCFGGEMICCANIKLYAYIIKLFSGSSP